MFILGFKSHIPVLSHEIHFSEDKSNFSVLKNQILIQRLRKTYQSMYFDSQTRIIRLKWRYLLSNLERPIRITGHAPSIFQRFIWLEASAKKKNCLTLKKSQYLIPLNVPSQSSQTSQTATSPRLAQWIQINSEAELYFFFSFNHIFTRYLPKGISPEFPSIKISCSKFAHPYFYC